MAQDPFFDKHPRRRLGFSDAEGNAYCFSFPTFFLRSASCLAVFSCSARKAAAFIGAPDFLPVRIARDRALITFICYEHHEIAEMPGYREAVIAIPVRYRPGWDIPVLPLFFRNVSARFGLYIWKMPVTSELNTVRGRVLWGLPKAKSEVSLRMDGNEADCRATEEGREMFSLRVRVERPETPFFQKTAVFSVLDGRCVKSFNYAQGRARSARSLMGLRQTAASARLVLGDSPSAGRLGGLELGPAPIEIRVSSGFRSVLTLPEPI